MTVITIKLIVEPVQLHPIDAVTQIISEAFGKEEQKEVPRAKLVLMELVEIR